MNAEKGHSQSADNSQLFAHKSSPVVRRVQGDVP